HARLAPEEQAAFRRASSFAGVWTVAEAVPVLALGDEETTAAIILRLLDASLVRVLPTNHDVPRMTLLAPLREFGNRLLEESGELMTTASRHVAAVLAFAEEASPELTGANQLAWLDRIDERLPDIRRAFAWFSYPALAPEGSSLRLATALWRHGYSRGSLRETVGWLEEALAMVTPADQALMRGNAINSLGLLVGMQGDHTRARALHAEALALGRAQGDLDLMGRASLGLGEQAVARKDLATAHNLIQQGSTYLARSKDLRGRAVALTNLANVLWSMGRLEEADALNREARSLYERIGDRRGIAWSVTNLGRIALQRKATAEAIPLLQDALRRYAETDDRTGIVEVLDALARCALATDDALAAARIVQATDRTRIELNYPVPEIDRMGEDAFRRQLGRHLATPPAPAVTTLDEAMALGHAVQASALPQHATATRPAPSTLSPREMEVLVLLKQGRSNQEISDLLFIGLRTVQSHVLHIMRKLDASSRVAAVAIAMQRGILPPDA
ncbi:MAG: tetratricopeptide repeat protein, partial [Thermomicrobiales bacterium]